MRVTGEYTAASAPRCAPSRELEQALAPDGSLSPESTSHKDFDYFWWGIVLLEREY